MRVFESIYLAYRNLKSRKLRTLLTAFAVFIGISLLATMISLGLGVRKWLLNQITSQMEYTRITVSQKGTFGAGGMMGGGSGNLVTEEDQQNIKIINAEAVGEIKKIAHVTQVEPMLLLMPKKLKVEGQEKYLKSSVGTGWDMTEKDTYSKKLLAGNLRDWYLKPENIILTNQTLKAYQLTEDQVLGKKVQLGFMKSAGLSQMLYQSQGEESIYEFTVVAVIDVGLDGNFFMISAESASTILAQRANMTSGAEYMEKVGYPILYVNTDDLGNTKAVADKINELGFQALTVGDLIGLINRVFIVIQAVLAVFGLIALFISALSIINTMIMAIYERTKEIGLLKAVGAKKKDIKNIFMTEAGFIGFLGGVFGTLAGILLNLAANKGLNIYLMQKGEPTQDFFSFPWWLVLGSIGFAVLLGILAGLYPASRAANLDPIEALRHE